MKGRKPSGMTETIELACECAFPPRKVADLTPAQLRMLEDRYKSLAARKAGNDTWLATVLSWDIEAMFRGKD